MIENLGTYKNERLQYGSSDEFIHGMCKKSLERVLSFYRTFARCEYDRQQISQLMKRLIRIEIYKQARDRFETDAGICNFLTMAPDLLNEMEMEFVTYGKNEGFRSLGKPLSYAVREIINDEHSEGTMLETLGDIVELLINEMNPC